MSPKVGGGQSGIDELLVRAGKAVACGTFIVALSATLPQGTDARTPGEAFASSEASLSGTKEIEWRITGRDARGRVEELKDGGMYAEGFDVHLPVSSGAEEDTSYLETFAGKGEAVCRVPGTLFLDDAGAHLRFEVEEGTYASITVHVRNREGASLVNETYKDVVVDATPPMLEARLGGRSVEDGCAFDGGDRLELRYQDTLPLTAEDGGPILLASVRDLASGAEIEIGPWSESRADDQVVWVASTPMLEDGSYEVRMEASDLVGNMSQPYARSFVVDAKGPSVSCAYDESLERHEEEGVCYFDEPLAIEVTMTDRTLDLDRSEILGCSLSAWANGDAQVRGVTCEGWEHCVDENGLAGVRVSLTLRDGAYESSRLACATDAFDRKSSLDSCSRQRRVHKIVVDTQAPIVSACVSEAPAYVSPDGAVCLFKDSVQVMLSVTDASGLHAVELEGPCQTAGLDLDLKEGAVVVSCGEEPFTRDTKLVLTDMSGNVRTWSLAPVGDRRTMSGRELVTNDPVTILNTGVPIASGGHPHTLMGDDAEPSVTVSGVDAGAHLNVPTAIQVSVRERTLGLMANYEPARMLYAIERDGERVASGTVGYDGANDGDVLHSYEIELPAGTDHADDGSYVLATSLVDLVGNASDREEIPFVIDTVPPVLDVALDDGGVLAADGTIYHTRSFTAHLTLVEQSFTAQELNDEDPRVRLEVLASDGSATQNVVVTDWREEPSGALSCDVTFPSDGSYGLRVSGSDHAGNVLVGSERTNVSEEGRFDLGTHVIDSTGPEVTIAYAPNAPTPHSYGGVDYFNKPVPVLVTVRDRHPDPSRAQVSDSSGQLRVPDWEVSGSEGEDKATLIATSWYREEDSGKGSGIKRPVVRVCDQAGNQTEVAMPEFVVDQTAPKVDRARMSRLPDVVMRDKDGGPIWFYRDRNDPVVLEIACTDEYPLDDVWANDPDGAYDAHAELAPTTGRSPLRIALRDFEQEGEGHDTVFDRGVRVFARDAAGNVCEWSLDEEGTTVADRPADSRNMAVNGAANRPTALVKDVTSPEVTLSATSDGTFNARPVDVEVGIREHGLSWLRELDPGRRIVSVRKRETTQDGEETQSVVSLGQAEVSSDDTTSRFRLETDGHYEVVAGLEDAAGNESDVVTTGEFTVDRTPPQVTVSWDNDDVRNGKYYRSPRTATITIREHDFDPSLVSIDTTGVVGAWSDEGDVHVCRVRFERDAPASDPHRLSVSAKDQAGNEAPVLTTPEFVIDTHVPSVRAARRVDTSDRYRADGPEETLVNESAFAQAFEPMVMLEDDASFDPSSVEVHLEGSRTDARDGWSASETQVATGPNGVRVSWGNLGLVEEGDQPRYLMEADDVYTLTARVTDLAGNVSPELSVRFSVNRFGSNFYVEPMASDADSSEGGEPLLANAPRIVVHEVNVSGDPVGEEGDGEASHLVTKEYAHATTSIERTDDDSGGGFLLTQSTERSTRNTYDGWTETRYEILPGNFGRGSDSDRGDGGQGAYRVDVLSTDKAQNNNSTALFWESDGQREGDPEAKGATVSFELDELGPRIEDLRLPDEWSVGGSFDASFRLVDAVTQGDRLEVLVDGRRVPVRREGSAEMVDDTGEVTRDGMFAFEIEPAPVWVPRTMEVRVSDYTGLVERSDVRVEKGFHRTTLAFELTLAAIALAACAGVRFVVRSRRLVP